jgi:hypothetical protein
MLAFRSQRMLGAGVLVMWRIVGMGDVFPRPLFLGALVVAVVLVELGRERLVQRGRNRGLDGGRDRRLDVVIIGRRLGRGIVGATGIVMIIVMIMTILMEVRVFSVVLLVRVFMLMAMFMAAMIVMPGFSVGLALMEMIVIGGCRRLVFGVLDDLALHALAAIAAARIAMACPTAAVTVLVLFLGLAVGALVGLDQRLTVGDRDLVIIGMDFAEGEEAVAIAAIFDKGGLQRRFDPRDLGEIDIAAKLLALRGLEIKLFDAIATDHDNPGLLRVGGIDQHFVRHF